MAVLMNLAKNTKFEISTIYLLLVSYPIQRTNITISSARTKLNVAIQIETDLKIMNAQNLSLL